MPVLLFLCLIKTADGYGTPHNAALSKYGIASTIDFGEDAVTVIDD
jgi:hypothetical protein